MTDLTLNFEEAWQTKYGSKILEEFSLWCKELVALHRTMKLPCKVSLPQANGRQSGVWRPSARETECPETECPETECPETECPETECPETECPGD